MTKEEYPKYLIETFKDKKTAIKAIDFMLKEINKPVINIGNGGYNDHRSYNKFWADVIVLILNAK